LGWSYTTIPRAALIDQRVFVSIRGIAVSFKHSLNSITADLRECSQVNSKFLNGIVAYNDPSRRAERSADIRVNPR
jgi:hypothetical protein